MDEIVHWTEDFEQPPIFWLSGLAGAGKSTIAQTVAERLFDNNRLGASFFCSRSVEARSNLQLIFPTLAFQLAQQHPKFRSSLIPLLQSDPDVMYQPLQDQMQKLLVKPLQYTGISTVIVIDALDECKDEDPHSAILSALGWSVSEIPGVKFFITSRPEMHIKTGFHGPLLKDSTKTSVLHDVEPRVIDGDMYHFFKHELSALAHRRGDVGGWPTDEQISLLCRRAAGSFAHAVELVKEIDHKFRDPSAQFELIAISPESTVHEGKTGLKVYTSLDSLFMLIFQQFFRKKEAKDDVVVRSALSAVVPATNPLSSSAMATSMGCNQVQRDLQPIQSPLVLPEDPEYPVDCFQTSFPNSITDPARCTNARFYVSPDYHHVELALHCFNIMGQSKRNMCSIPSYVLNSEVEDLSERIKASGMRGAPEYACKSWHKHLVATKDRAADVISGLRSFLKWNFLWWLEVLSVLDAVDEATRALDMTAKWLNEVRPDWQSDSQAPWC